MTTITELPKDGQKVEFKLSEHGPWINAYYYADFKQFRFFVKNQMLGARIEQVYAWRPRKEGEDA